MAEQSCGASVQACAIRVATLEQDGVPLPGVGLAYVTDQLMKMVATPNNVKGADMDIINACGILINAYKARDMFKRYDLALDMTFISPEFEHMLCGGELFTQGGFAVGGSSPAFGAIEAVYGVSVELWTKHIVNGDFDPIWPYIQWVFPRTYWTVGPDTFENNPMQRSFVGYTSQNPNYFNGPFNDWTFASDRSRAYRFTRTLPTPNCGAIAIASS
jgi:hypothetical protein